MERNPPQAKSMPEQKGANQDPKIKDTGKVSDSELNKAAGGFSIKKNVDVARPVPFKDDVGGSRY